ncbi:MAG: YgjV family protein [Clostridia bacterium]|nr:YgjV family protein [Clostridia bacterium]
MNTEVLYWVGQAFGFLAVALTLLTYLMKTPLRLLLALSGAILSMMINYVFLGAWAGVFLNAVSLLRNVIFMLALRYPVLKKKPVSYALIALMFAVGVYSWLSAEGDPFTALNLSSWLFTVALTVNTYFLSLENNRKLRYSIFFTSSLVLTYNVIFSSWGGILNEAVAIGSAAIGTIMYRKKKAC